MAELRVRASRRDFGLFKGGIKFCRSSIAFVVLEPSKWPILCNQTPLERHGYAEDTYLEPNVKEMEAMTLSLCLLYTF